jgi:hypothetical protein
MIGRDKRITRTLEIMLILVVIGLTCILYTISGFKMMVLNLYYLPVVLGAFFLGRYRAGILALFCATAALAVVMLDIRGFQPQTSPAAVALLVTIWGAVLGLTTLLVGTLSDERSKKLAELHDAYLGIVEVLSGYLNSADKRLKSRAARVSELSCMVATKMKLTDEEIDDIRVAALLQEMENVEVTARVISKAIGDIGRRGRGASQEHTFRGADLVDSLASVVYRALPLLTNRDDAMGCDSGDQGWLNAPGIPLGTKIIHTVRCYDMLVESGDENLDVSPQLAIVDLLADDDNGHHPAILLALQQCVPSALEQRHAVRESAEMTVAGA